MSSEKIRNNHADGDASECTYISKLIGTSRCCLMNCDIIVIQITAFSIMKREKEQLYEARIALDIQNCKVSQTTPETSVGKL
jgi:hypothetical protein